MQTAQDKKKEVNVIIRSDAAGGDVLRSQIGFPGLFMGIISLDKTDVTDCWKLLKNFKGFLWYFLEARGSLTVFRF